MLIYLGCSGGGLCAGGGVDGGRAGGGGPRGLAPGAMPLICGDGAFRVGAHPQPGLAPAIHRLPLVMQAAGALVVAVLVGAMYSAGGLIRPSAGLVATGADAG